MEDVFQVVLYISASLALLALAWLFVSLSSTFKGLRSVLDETTKVAHGVVEQVEGLRTSMQGTIQNVELITSRVPGTIDRVNESVDRVNGQLAEVEGIIGSVRHLTDGLANDVTRLADDATDLIHAAKGVAVSLIDLEQNIQMRVQKPVVELVTLFSALGNGIHAFRMKLASNGVNGYTNGSATVARTTAAPMAAEGRLVGTDSTPVG